MNRTTLKSHVLRAATALCVAALAPSISQALPQGQKSGAGMNLSGWDYWVPDMPLIDQFKRSSGWLTQCYYPTNATCKDFTNGAGSWDTLEQAKMNVDENGWVKSLPAANDTPSSTGTSRPCCSLAMATPSRLASTRWSTRARARSSTA